MKSKDHAYHIKLIGSPPSIYENPSYILHHSTLLEVQAMTPVKKIPKPKCHNCEYLSVSQGEDRNCIPIGLSFL